MSGRNGKAKQQLSTALDDGEKEPFVENLQLTFGASICHVNNMTLDTPKVSCCCSTNSTFSGI